jgi:hypothetical protein
LSWSEPKVLSEKCGYSRIEKEKNLGKLDGKLFHVFVFVLLASVSFAAPCVNASLRVSLVDLAPPSSTSISCDVSSKSVVLGSSIFVSGTISPAAPNVSVTLNYTRPDSTTFSHTETTGSDGSYNETYAPDVTGNWKVMASWAGNDNFFGASSFEFAFNVTSTSSIDYAYVYAIVAVVVVVVVGIVVFLLKRKK